jgi:hypothetical protein
MSQRLFLNIDAVDREIADRAPGARIELQRDTTSAFGAPTNLTPVTLVAGDSQYAYFDEPGTTSSWYRFRLTDNAGAKASAWSDPFQGGAANAYAGLDALREVLSLPDDTHDNYLLDLLRDASAYLDAACERDFYRHPAVSGTEVRTFPGNAALNAEPYRPDPTLLEVRAGIVSLTTVELAEYTGAAYTALASTDWYLDPAIIRPDRTWRDGVQLSERGAFVRFPFGDATVRLTGVFGAATIPDLIRKATLDLAREWFRQGPGGGGPVGVNQYGTPIFGGAEPKSVRDAIANYRWRSWVVV